MLCNIGKDKTGIIVFHFRDYKTNSKWINTRICMLFMYMRRVQRETIFTINETSSMQLCNRCKSFTTFISYSCMLFLTYITEDNKWFLQRVIKYEKFIFLQSFTMQRGKNKTNCNAKVEKIIFQ